MRFRDIIRGLAAASIDVQKAASDGVGPDQFLPYSAATSGRPIPVEWDDRNASAEGYKASSWVYACVDRLAGAASRVPWRVLEKRGEEWEAQADSPWELAIEYPSEFFSRQYMVHLAATHLSIGGNALWQTQPVKRLVRGSLAAVPDGFSPMYTAIWRPVPDPVRWVAGYKRIDGQGVYHPPIEAARVVHAQYPDPDNFLWGHSPLRAVAKVIDMDVAQVRWNANLPKNRMNADYVIVDRTLTNRAQLDEAVAALRRRAAGPENAGVPLVLGAGTEAIRTGMTPQELDWLESRRFTLIEICAAFGLLPSMFVPESKYANLADSIKFMWENGATRILATLEDALNTRLIPRALRAKFWIHYDTSGVEALRDSLKTRLESHEIAVRSGVPINKSFHFLDIAIEDIEGGDEPLVSSSLLPLSQVLEKPEPPLNLSPADRLPPIAADDAEEDPADAEASAN